MRTKLIIFLIFTFSLASLGLLVTVIFNSPPSGMEVLTLFYSSLFVTLFGLIFFTSYIVQYWRLGGLPTWQQTSNSLHTGLIGSLVASILMLLEANDFLNAITAVVIVVGGAIVWLALKKRKFFR